jgi:NuA3 HAT complex component NTO1
VKGGAYKPTTKGKWVHVDCALIIPGSECFAMDVNKMEPFSLKNLDPDRFKLPCASKSCRITRGACIQCAYKGCTGCLFVCLFVCFPFDYFLIVKSNNLTT